MKLSTEEMINMIYILGECDRNCLLASRMYAVRYPDSRSIRPETFRRVKERFDETGSVKHEKRQVVNKIATNEENELAVILSTVENPHVSTREIARELDINHTSVNRILIKNKLHPYRIELHQELYERDYDTRVRYCENILNFIREEPNFLKYILFSDESTFKSNGIVNRHNCHYYSTENPHWVREIDYQNRWSINVWRGIIGDQVIGPHFFDGPLNGEIYRDFLRDHLPILLEDVPIDTRLRLYYQHDGAPPHNQNQVRWFLNRWRSNKWIGRNGPIQWPARSPDLTPLDFYLWGYVKGEVYREKPTTPEDMKNRIREVFHSITKSTLIEVGRANVDGLSLCMARNGRLFEHLM